MLLRLNETFVRIAIVKTSLLLHQIAADRDYLKLDPPFSYVIVVIESGELVNR